jgi:hypothetical protein
MASELRVNTLKDAAGSNSVGMEYVANGSAKAWSNVSGSQVVNDSLNVSSITDNSSGNYDLNWTNSFANTTYSHVGTDGNFGNCQTSPHTLSTGSADVYTWNASSSATSDASFATSEHGDLA